MTNTTNDWLAEYQAEAKRRAKRLAAAKQPILAALRRARIAGVEVDYDGECDQGQIADIAAVDRNNKPAALKGTVLVNLDGRRRKHALREALEAFTWEVLAAYHDGFEDNEGGFGTLSIDVASGRFSLSHNARVIEVSNTLEEV